MEIRGINNARANIGRIASRREVKEDKEKELTIKDRFVKTAKELTGKAILGALELADKVTDKMMGHPILSLAGAAVIGSAIGGPIGAGLLTAGTAFVLMLKFALGLAEAIG